MRVVFDATSTLLPSSGVKSFVYFLSQSLRKFAGPHSLSFYPLLGNLGTLNHTGSNQRELSTEFRLLLVHLINILGHPLTDAIFRHADLVHISQHMRNLPLR